METTCGQPAIHPPIPNIVTRWWIHPSPILFHCHTSVQLIPLVYIIQRICWCSMMTITSLNSTTQFYTLHVKWLTLHSMAINSPISSPYKQNVHKSVKFDQEPVMSKPASNIPQVFERHEQKIVLIFLHHQPIGFASEVVNLTCNQSCNQLGKRSFTGQKIPGSQTSSLDSSYVHDSIREEHGS